MLKRYAAFDEGSYPPHTGNVLLKVVIFVLMTSFFERFAYYTASGSLSIYFRRELGLDANFSSKMQALWQSIVYVVPIISAYLMDSYLGRYVLLPVSLFMCVIGTSLWAIAAVYKITWLSYIAIFFFIAVFDGGIKPGLMVIGGDQFNFKITEQIEQKTQMFVYYYWATNFAAGIAFLLMAQIAVQGMGSISPENGFFVTFVVGAVAYAASFSVISAVREKLWVRKPSGSALPTFFKVTYGAMKNSVSGRIVVASYLALFGGILLAIPNFFLNNDIVTYITVVLILTSMFIMIIFGRKADWVNAATGFEPADVQATFDIYRLSPYIAFNIPFWAVYNQMNSNFITQGCQMDTSLGSSQVSPTLLLALNCIVIVISIPIIQHLLVPLVTKCGVNVTPLKRVGFGMFLTVLAMIVAGILEMLRRDADILTFVCTESDVAENLCRVDQINEYLGVQSSCAEANAMDPDFERIPKSALSIWYQILSYGMVGLSEIFVAATMTDFFYSEAPESYRAVTQAINLLTVSLGTMVGAVINTLFYSLLPNNLNNGKQDVVYYVNAGLVLLALVAFVVVSRSFEYRTVNSSSEVVSDASSSSSSSSSSSTSSSSESSDSSSVASSAVKSS